MGMDMYCQREVLREATMNPTIAMGLHVCVAILKKYFCNPDGIAIEIGKYTVNYQNQKNRPTPSIFAMFR